MAMLADQLRQFLSTGKWPQKNDNYMVRPPMDGEKSGRVVTPDKMMQDKENDKNPGNIRNDQGSIVDFISNAAKGDNPFSRLLQQNQGEAGRGSIMGLLSRFLSPTPEAQVPGQVQGQGTVGGGDPNRGTPGTGRDPALDPTPSKNQKVPAFKPVETPAAAPPPADYSMPNALNPQQIEELRLSLLTDAGQMDASNPNGLSGRMNSPNAAADIRNQGQETQDIANGVRNRYNSVSGKSPQ